MRRRHLLLTSATAAVLGAGGAQAGVSQDRRLAVLGELDESARKQAFIAMILPISAAVNRGILQERATLLGLNRRLVAGQRLRDTEAIWIGLLAKRYRVGPDPSGRIDIAQMMPRVDEVPPALVIAQAALESGWGTSRYAREGNSLFGQITTGPNGMRSLDPDNSLRMRAFANVEAAVMAYKRNLNSHRAYGAFRAVRARQRSMQPRLDSKVLARSLAGYCPTCDDYVATLTSILDDPALRRLDRLA